MPQTIVAANPVRAWLTAIVQICNDESCLWWYFVCGHDRNCTQQLHASPAQCIGACRSIMSDSTTRRCQVLTIRGLYFLLGHTDATVAGADGVQPRAAQPDTLRALAADALASRSNGTQS